MTVYVALGCSVAACIATAVDKLLDLYKKFLEVKRLRAEMKKQGLTDEDLQGVTKRYHTMMEKGIEQITIEVFETYYKGNDAGRENELKNGVRISLNKLANRIDRGFNIEVRVASLPESANPEETTDSPAEVRQHVQTIQTASKNLQFMRVEGEPILSLPENEEGEEVD